MQNSTATAQDKIQVIKEIPHILLIKNEGAGSRYFGYLPAGSNAVETIFGDEDHGFILYMAQSSIWKTKVETVPEDERLFRIKKSEEGGLVMYAARDILMGELIHKERPLYAARKCDYIGKSNPKTKYPYLFRSALEKATQRQQDAYLALRNAHISNNQVDPLMGIYLTNSQGASMPDPHDLGPGLDFDTIFTTLSLAGHSCVPNAHYIFYPSDFTGRFYACRDIKIGEEITIDYIEPLDTQARRKDHLWRGFKIRCNCEACDENLTAEQVAISDKNRLAIARVQNGLTGLCLNHVHAKPPSSISIEDINQALELLA